MTKLRITLLTIFFGISAATFCQWQEANSGLYGGQVNSLAIDPNTGNIYAGTYNGVYLSTDNGDSWVARDNGFSSLGIQALAISGNIIYAGTGDGVVYRSTNSGSNWEALNYDFEYTPKALAINDDFIFIGTAGGVFLSSDNGTSWEQASNGLESEIGSSGFHRVNCLAINGSNIFAGMSFGAGVYLSKDNGNSWEQARNGLEQNIFGEDTTFYSIECLAVDSNTGSIYAGTFGGGVFLSDDNGNSWNAINNGLTNTSVLSIAIDESNIYAGTLEGGVFISDNSGGSWTQINNGLSESENGLTIESMAINGNSIFAGTQGLGVYLSTDNGSNWTDKNNGLTCTEIFSLISKENTLFAGTQYGGFISRDGGTSWERITNGLPIDDNIADLAIIGDFVFAGTLNNGMFLSSDNGNSWNEVNNGLPEYSAIWSLAENNDTILAGTSDGVFLSKDNGSSWTEANVGLPTESIYAIVAQNGNIFAQTRNSVYLSTDNGSSWVEKNSGLSGSKLGFAQSLVINNDKVYVITREGVYISNDNGDNWILLNNGLPEDYTTSLFVNEGDLFAGTLGVYFSSDSGNNWSDISNGLPDLYTSVFTVVEQEIFVGCARGIWKRPLSEIYSLDVSEESITIEAVENSTATFSITSNAHWEVISSETWLTVSPSNGSGDETITLNALENPESSTRTATVNVSGRYVANKEISVTQNGSAVGVSNEYYQDIIIYPNPAINAITIRGLQQEAIVHIFNANGQMISSSKIGAESSEISVSKLSSGLYFLKINSDEGVVVMRFAKQ
jgi:photosystem II stability/assembly factor-like uncharacterized protein